MASPRHLLTVPIALAAFGATFAVVGRLLCFLSLPSQISAKYVWLLNLLDNQSRVDAALLPITVDLILAVLFVLQHSLMKTAAVASLWRRLGLQTVERSLYNLATAFTLHLVLDNWRPVPTFMLWQLDVARSPAAWWSFVALHSFAWFIILGGTVLMDLPELLGVKQVFYDTQRLLAPMLYKSDELKRLYGHVRHPSFVGLSVVLWAPNAMSLDRLLLATIWTAYMYVAWNTDEDDVSYHRCQLVRKRQELAADASAASGGASRTSNRSGSHSLLQ